MEILYLCIFVKHFSPTLHLSSLITISSLRMDINGTVTQPKCASVCSVVCLVSIAYDFQEFVGNRCATQYFSLDAECLNKLYYSVSPNTSCVLSSSVSTTGIVVVH